MPYRLRDNLHWCESGGRAVFLDVETDRYFCLPATANDAFLALRRGEDLGGGFRSLRVLVDRGLLIATATQAAALEPPSLEEPVRDFPPEPTGRAGLGQAARALFHEFHAALLVRTRPFRSVIAIASARNCRVLTGADNPEGRIASIVRAFQSTALVTRAHDRCLVRALAVHAACTRRGIRPKLVFGVIAHPFSAHCWVQFGASVLVGEFEQARLYTPILVIG